MATHSISRACMQKLGALHVRIEAHMATVENDWRVLERSGVYTYFQTHAWCSCWVTRIAPLHDAKPVFVVGYMANGKPAFLLPLQVRRLHGIDAIEFLSAPHASYGFGIFDKTFLKTDAIAWFSQYFDAILALLPRHDIVYLREMPDTMLGHPNPMSQHARLKDANHAYMMALAPDFGALLASKRSHDSIRSMRKRDKRLAAMGDLEFGLPANEAERMQVLEHMFQDHQMRLSETGVLGVYGTAERAFLGELCDTAQYGEVALRPYRLKLDGTAICILLGGRACNAFWAMITSLGTGAARKHSPGDFTLRHVIAAQCADDVQFFDFAAGDSDYKIALADEKIDLRLVLRAHSLKGFAVTLYLLLRHSAKRMIKRNSQLRSFAFAVRQLLLARKEI